MSELTTRLVKVYKSLRKADTFLYVDFQEDLDRVPAGLLDQFGTPEFTLSLHLKADRKLARAVARDVLQRIQSVGYYLQMPPADGGVDAEIRNESN